LVGKMLIGDVSSPRTFSFNGSCYPEKLHITEKGRLSARCHELLRIHTSRYLGE
jgi:hypothetical protein